MRVIALEKLSDDLLQGFNQLIDLCFVVWPRSCVCSWEWVFSTVFCVLFWFWKVDNIKRQRE